MECGLKSASEERDVPLAMRIAERSVRRGSGVRIRRLLVIVAEFLEAAAGADGIDVALGQDGAKPGLQRAATVKIPEERALGALAAIEAVKIGEERVGKFGGFRGAGSAMKNRSGCRMEVDAIAGKKLFPGGFAAFGTSAGQRQVLQMKGTEIFFELPRSGSAGGEALFGAAFQGSGPALCRESPAACLRLEIQGFENGGGAVQKEDGVLRCGLGTSIWGVCGHLPFGVKTM